ncbi:MAG: CehA/McbA family metallohydrolase [Anaerolineae bacterium]|nr:CehA/McbA family metallohydrolase [Anaerolineae bacterium]
MQENPIEPDNPFALPGRWYRASLHTHTTLSDGERTPEEAVAWYREHGYDVLALTDHDLRAEVEGLSTPGFLVLPGAEVHPDETELGEPHHLVAVGISRSHAFSRQDSVQDAIDELRADGAVVWLGHPYWLGVTLPELAGLRGIIGLEVYNTTCAQFGKGLSAVHWDDLLARGRLLWGLSVDDAHWGHGDYGQGWVMIKARELTQPAILQALAAGHFYATQGPEIHDFQVTPEAIHVRCSPACRINCISLGGYGGLWALAGADGLLTEATFRRRQPRTYVRVECADAEGRTAWTQPVMID